MIEFIDSAERDFWERVLITTVATQGYTTMVQMLNCADTLVKERRYRLSTEIKKEGPYR